MRKLVLIGLVAALAGCANLQEVNDSLKKANAALSGATSRPVGQLGDGSGYQPVFNIAVPGGVCHQQAFIDGFKDSYLQNWNQFVSTKVTQYTAETMKANASAAAKKNLALYQSRVIGTKKYIGHAMDYKLDVSSFNANNCPYQSYQKGMSAGMDAVSSDWKALVAQEL
jgi:hypothetical protein